MQALRNAMGLGNTLGALPVANGGTGAVTASNALANLGCVIVDQVSDLTASQGYAISPAGVKAWFEQQSAQAISGSAQLSVNTAKPPIDRVLNITLTGSNSNFTNNGTSLVINQAGTYSFNVTATVEVIRLDEPANVGIECTVGSSKTSIVAASQENHSMYDPSVFISGNDSRNIYVDAGTAVSFNGFVRNSDRSYVSMGYVVSFSISRVV